MEIILRSLGFTTALISEHNIIIPHLLFTKLCIGGFPQSTSAAAPVIIVVAGVDIAIFIQNQPPLTLFQLLLFFLCSSSWVSCPSFLGFKVVWDAMSFEETRLPPCSLPPFAGVQVGLPPPVMSLRYSR